MTLLSEHLLLQRYTSNTKILYSTHLFPQIQSSIGVLDPAAALDNFMLILTQYFDARSADSGPVSVMGFPGMMALHAWNTMLVSLRAKEK